MSSKKASTKGIRYSDAQKQEIVDFVVKFNSENGRGGQSEAAKKFNISQLTIATWLKKSGVKKASKKAAAVKTAKAPKVPKAAKAAKAASVSSSGSLQTKLNSLVTLNNQIAKLETELASLKSKFAAIKASL
jgi:transposase-like protein